MIDLRKNLMKKLDLRFKKVVSKIASTVYDLINDNKIEPGTVIDLRRKSNLSPNIIDMRRESNPNPNVVDMRRKSNPNPNVIDMTNQLKPNVVDMRGQLLNR